MQRFAHHHRFHGKTLHIGRGVRHVSGKPAQSFSLSPAGDIATQRSVPAGERAGVRGDASGLRAPHPNPLPHHPVPFEFQNGSWGRGSAQFSACTHRGGFTLIELLVVMGILLLLATISVAAYRGVSSADRVSGGARNFKTSLEGARSRAIADGQARGIRLVLDPNIPHVVTSIVPIGAAEFYEGEFSVVENSPGFNLWNCTDITGPTGAFVRMEQRGLIAEGSRVEIPAFSNRWYPVFAQSGTDIQVRGELFLPDQDGDPMNEITAYNVSFRLQLAPPILPGAEPVVFPRGVGIDLNGCLVPDAWRPGTTADFYSTNMDIMFAANGALTGGLTGTGLVHLYFGDVEDIERSAVLRGDVPVTIGQLPIVPASPQNADQLVSLFTQTGMSVVAEVDHTDTDTDNIADPATVFQYATAGREAK